MCKMCFREIWHLGLPFFLVSLRMIYYIFSTWKMQERMQYTLNYYGRRFFIMVQFFFNIYIVSLSWLNCSIVIALVFCKFLCFICNKIKCVTGLHFYKIHVLLFWTEHRGEGWGSGHSTHNSHQFGLGSSLAMYAMYGLGTGHYLLLGAGRGILGEVTRFLGEQKGDQS